MASEGHAAHVLAHQQPELTKDEVSRYARHLKEALGPAKSAAAYSAACRATPIGENELDLHRGTVVELEGDKYLALGAGFLTLEFASLSHQGPWITQSSRACSRRASSGSSARRSRRRLWKPSSVPVPPSPHVSPGRHRAGAGY